MIWVRCKCHITIFMSIIFCRRTERSLGWNIVILHVCKRFASLFLLQSLALPWHSIWFVWMIWNWIMLVHLVLGFLPRAWCIKIYKNVHEKVSIGGKKKLFYFVDAHVLLVTCLLAGGRKLLEEIDVLFCWCLK